MRRIRTYLATAVLVAVVTATTESAPARVAVRPARDPMSTAEWLHLPDVGARLRRLLRPEPLAIEIVPVIALPSSQFGYRRDPFSRRRRFHAGLDFAAPLGSPVRAAAGGVVVKARTVRGYGRLVVIDHGGGYTTRYAHLRRIHVRVGDQLAAGGVVGAVGSSGRSTGPHLHFEVRKDGRPTDPMEFFAPAARWVIRTARQWA